MNLIVIRRDTGEHLTRSGEWCTDLQEARLFTRASTATTAAKDAFGAYRGSRAQRAALRLPSFDHAEVAISLKR